MLRPQKTNFSFAFAFCLLSFSLLTSKAAFAVEATTEVGPSAPCAVVENYTGDVEILDPSRTHMTTIAKNVGIACGGWVSSGVGWAIIRHRDGHELRVGPSTFIEIPENSTASPDQVVLYHGEMFGSTEGSGGDLQIITANARVRLPKGDVIVNYDPENQDTQLVALDAPASLENRFEPERKIIIKPGESTSLNFKLLRVTPTYAKAVSVAALRDKLTMFRVNEKDASEDYEVAENRAERRLAATLTPEQVEADKPPVFDRKSDDANPAPAPADDDLDMKKTVVSRKIASDSESTSSNYERSQLNADEAAALKSHFVRKLTAGEDVGERILFPDKFHGKPKKVNLVIEDPGAAMDANHKKIEDKEKQKLIEELSQIHED